MICEFYMLKQVIIYYSSITNDPGVLSYGLFASKIEEYFKGGKYVIGDSAYKREPWCIPVKKLSFGGGLSCSDEKFNCYLSHTRVRVEHCFAALKGRFASLEELRTTVKIRGIMYSKWIDGLKYVLYYITFV